MHRSPKIGLNNGTSRTIHKQQNCVGVIINHRTNVNKSPFYSTKTLYILQYTVVLTRVVLGNTIKTKPEFSIWAWSCRKYVGQWLIAMVRFSQNAFCRLQISILLRLAKNPCLCVRHVCRQRSMIYYASSKHCSWCPENSHSLSSLTRNFPRIFNSGYKQGVFVFCCFFSLR